LTVSLFYIYKLTNAQIVAESLIPLSPSSYSYKIGNPASNVIVEFFLDLGCSACLQSWPTLQKLVENYVSSISITISSTSIHFIKRLVIQKKIMLLFL